MVNGIPGRILPKGGALIQVTKISALSAEALWEQKRSGKFLKNTIYTKMYGHSPPSPKSTKGQGNRPTSAKSQQQHGKDLEKLTVPKERSSWFKDGGINQDGYNSPEAIEHKFDNVDVNEFYDNSPYRRFKYSLIFFALFQSAFVLFADIFTLILQFTPTLQTGSILVLSNESQGKLGNNSLAAIPIEVRRYIVLVSILISFLLLGHDYYKARRIIQSRDIGLAFTSVMAHRYYCLKSYAHYCFLERIQQSRKRVDVLAFFVYWSFKSWKRLLLAEAPRRIFNFFTIYDIISAYNPKNISDFFNIFGQLVGDSWGSRARFLVLAFATFTFIVWFVNMISLVVSFFIYVPLVSRVKGNLKEYCVKKIDKRIANLLRRQALKKREKMYDENFLADVYDDSYSTFSDAMSITSAKREPTLPNVDDYPPSYTTPAPPVPPLPVAYHQQPSHVSYVSTVPSSTKTMYMGNTNNAYNQPQYNQYENDYVSYADYSQYSSYAMPQQQQAQQQQAQPSQSSTSSHNTYYVQNPPSTMSMYSYDPSQTSSYMDSEYDYQSRR